MRTHALIKPEMTGERALQDPHPIASLELLAPGQLDQAAALAGLNFKNEAIGHRHRCVPGGEQLDDARTPSGVPPTGRDRNEQIAREQRRMAHNLAPAPRADQLQSRAISLIASQSEKVRRRSLAVRLSLPATPVSHGSPPPSSQPSTFRSAATAGAVLGKRRQIGGLATAEVTWRISVCGFSR